MANDDHQILRDFFGQRRAVNLLRRIARGSIARGDPLPHMLFIGGSGLGKTRLAQSLARDLGVRCHLIPCSRAITPTDFAQAAEKWQPHDLVHLDEVHALSPSAQECIYRIMTDARAPKIAETPGGKRSSLDLERSIPLITVIGATDRPGSLLAAFRKRFVHTVTLRPYRVSEMIQIVRHVGTERGIVLTPQARRFMAERCRGIPRSAEHFVQKLQLLFADREDSSEFTQADVRRFFAHCGVDRHGRAELDRRYMAALMDGPRSLQTLSLLLQVDRIYLRSEIEPWIIQEKWLVISRDGRCLTPAGVTVVTSTSRGGKS